MLFGPYVRFHILSSVRVTEWPPIGEYLLTRLTTCFQGNYKFLSVILVFSHPSVYGMGISF